VEGVKTCFPKHTKLIRMLPQGGIIKKEGPVSIYPI
jgi:hypothetical protein